MMNRRRVLAALGSAVGGGCLRMSGTGEPTPSQPTDPPATSEPTQRSEETPEPTSVDGGGNPSYPIGLSDSGVEALLFSSHKRALTETSFKMRRTRIDRKRSEIVSERQFSVADLRAIGEWSFEGPVTTYLFGNQALWRENLGDHYTYGRDRDGFSMSRVTWERWLLPIISSGDWSTPTLVQEQDPAIWQVQADGFQDSTSVPGFYRGEYTSLSASLQADENGIIHEMQATFSLSTRNSGAKQQQVRFSLDSIGGVSVSEPDWVETAEDRSPVISVDITDDQQFVRFSVESGNQIEPNTSLTVYDDINQRNAIAHKLQRPVSAGETVYLYKENQDAWSGQIARGTKPTDASPVQLDNEYRCWAHRNGVEYYGSVEV